MKSMSVLVVTCMLALTGCTAVAPDATAKPGAAPAPTQMVQVYAAASLTAAFDELARRFEADHPDIDVLPIVYGGSSTLATQIVEGAPADVFASADEPNMKSVRDADLVAGPASVFATNTLVVALAPGNPAGVKTLSDLAKASLVLCAPEVPCGRASQKLLENQRVTLTPVSLEQSVTAVLQKVALGEADAGLVYATDVAGADAESFVPQGADQVVNSYPIGALNTATHPAAAAKFVEFVLGDAGAQVLMEFGFGGR